MSYWLICLSYDGDILYIGESLHPWDKVYFIIKYDLFNVLFDSAG